MRQLVTIIKRSKHLCIKDTFDAIACHPEYYALALDSNYGTRAQYVFSNLVVFGRVDCVKLLLERGDVDVDQQVYKDSHTPLVLALLDGKMAMFKFLLASGADPNVVGGYFLKANTLQIAIMRSDKENWFEICDLLLAHGADVHATDSFYWNTIMHTLATICAPRVAEDRQFRQIYHALIERGALIDTRNRCGQTPLDLCKTKANVLMAGLIHGTMRERQLALPKLSFYAFLTYCSKCSLPLPFDVRELIARHIVSSCTEIN